MEQERDVLNYTVRELMDILVSRGGTSANFSFKGPDDKLVAVITIATMEDAYRLRNICKEYFSEV